MDKRLRRAARGLPKAGGQRGALCLSAPFQCSVQFHLAAATVSPGPWPRTVPSQAESQEGRKWRQEAEARASRWGPGRPVVPHAWNISLPGGQEQGPSFTAGACREQVGSLRGMEPGCSSGDRGPSCPCSEMGTQGSRSPWLTQTRVLRTRN